MSEAIRYRLPMTSRAAEMSLNLKRGITNRGRWVADPLGKDRGALGCPTCCSSILVWPHMVTYGHIYCNRLHGWWSQFISPVWRLHPLRPGIYCEVAGKVRSSWDINKWICSNFCHNWSLTWIIYFQPSFARSCKRCQWVFWQSYP